jgi:regulator of sigma E protease
VWHAGRTFLGGLRQAAGLNAVVSFKRGDTVYQIAPIPLGGFVQITGLNPHEEFDQNDPYVYPNRPRWMRFLVLVAGPGANYLAAVLMALGMFIGYGKAMPTNDVVEVVAKSPAEAAGLKAGDVLIEANSKTLSPDVLISSVVRQSEGQPVTIKLKRGAAEPQTLTITPRKDPRDGVFRIGIATGTGFVPISVTQSMKEAVILPAVLTVEMLKNIREMIVGKQPANLSGPVGIARHMAKAAEQGAMSFLSLVMYLSIYLGLFNLLPLPALDGGRVLFLGINSLPIKQVSAKTEAAVHMVGLLLLLGVFVIVTFNDIKEIVVRIVN